MIKLPTAVQTVINFFETSGYNAFVAGGAARNLHFGVPVNDWDIVVERGDLDEASTFRILEDLCLEFRTKYPAECNASITQAYEDASNDFDDRWLGLAQLDYNDISIDILVSQEPTIAKTLAKFDSNVNQCCIAGGWVIWFNDEPPVDIQFLKPITIERYTRLVKLSGELNLPLIGMPKLCDKRNAHDCNAGDSQCLCEFM